LSNSDDEVTDMVQIPDYDVFISHAREDKEVIAKPIATALSTLGVSVWYDGFALKVGDSLSRSMDEGLSRSRYGIVILSKSFLGKPWPDYELRSLVTKEIELGKVILPIWSGVEREEVFSFSHMLADKFALQHTEGNLNALVAELLAIIRPDISLRLGRLLRAGFERIEGVEVAPNNIRVGPGVKRYSQLPRHLFVRAAIVGRTFEEHQLDSIEDFCDDFLFDTHPDQEIAIWEAMALCYLTFLHERRNASKETRRDAYAYLVAASTGQVRSHGSLKHLDDGDLQFLDFNWQQFGVEIPIGITPIGNSGDAPENSDKLTADADRLKP